MNTATTSPKKVQPEEELNHSEIKENQKKGFPKSMQNVSRGITRS